MFCLERKDLIIVKLHLLRVVTQKFDRVTITRLSKMPSDYEDFYSEGSNHFMSFQAESSIHFLKCRHFSVFPVGQGSHFGCLSLRVCPQDI